MSDTEDSEACLPTGAGDIWVKNQFPEMVVTSKGSKKQSSVADLKAPWVPAPAKTSSQTNIIFNRVSLAINSLNGIVFDQSLTLSLYCFCRKLDMLYPSLAKLASQPMNWKFLMLESQLLRPVHRLFRMLDSLCRTHLLQRSHHRIQCQDISCNRRTPLLTW